MSTILEIVTKDPQFSLLAGMIAQVDEGGLGLDALLSSDTSQYTLFAPTNAAIVNLANAIGYPDPDPSGASQYVMAAINSLSGGNSAALLAQILVVHVARGTVTEADINTPGFGPIDTVLGITLTVENGRIVDADPDNADAAVVGQFAVDNGNVIAIDQLLLPQDLDPDLSGSPQDDIVVGSSLGDVYALLEGDDIFGGGDGDDIIDGGAGNDLIHGGRGDDVLTGGDGDDRLEGQHGKDKLIGGAGDDILNGDQGNDILRGGAGDDFLQGGSGNDFLSGNSGDDKLRGGNGDDILWGRSGMDQINGGAGEDVLHGGDGRDHLFGGSGDDIVNGGAGDDFVAGGMGDDRVSGNSGDDHVKGNSGDDILIGGAGDDTYEGNDGADIFAFDYQTGANTIIDFTSGEDRIQLAPLEDGKFLSFQLEQGDGNDLLITSTVNDEWSVLVLDKEDLHEEDLFFA